MSFTEKVILLATFFSIIALGFFISIGSISNQEGYAEISWQLNHLSFAKTLLSPAVTPLIFLIPFILDKVFSLSIQASWKLMDLTFAALLGVFLIKLYYSQNRKLTLTEKLIPSLVILSSYGYIYSFTSMSGEGMPIFFAVIGLYFWSKYKFIVAALWFIISFFSKYTIFLIAPGIFLWTLFRIRSLNRKKIRELIFAVLFGLFIFCIYGYIKHWKDIQHHAVYITDLSPEKLLINFPPYILALLIGAPIVAIFAFIFPQFTNLYYLAAVSAFIMLLRRYYYWNHPQQIISMLMLYFFTHATAPLFLKPKIVLLQLIFFLSLLSVLPIHFRGLTLFHKHTTKQESFAVEDTISKNYNGGQIGYYLNRRFDVPYPNYEISYMHPSWNFVIEDTEYVVVPFATLPQQLVQFKNCQYIFYDQISLNVIYKVICTKNLQH